jgi:hypothetical protein
VPATPSDNGNLSTTLMLLNDPRFIVFVLYAPLTKSPEVDGAHAFLASTLTSLSLWIVCKKALPDTC